MLLWSVVGSSVLGGLFFFVCFFLCRFTLGSVKITPASDKPKGKWPCETTRVHGPPELRQPSTAPFCNPKENGN